MMVSVVTKLGTKLGIFFCPPEDCFWLCHFWKFCDLLPCEFGEPLVFLEAFRQPFHPGLTHLRGKRQQLPVHASDVKVGPVGVIVVVVVEVGKRTIGKGMVVQRTTSTAVAK